MLTLDILDYYPANKRDTHTRYIKYTINIYSIYYIYNITIIDYNAHTNLQQCVFEQSHSPTIICNKESQRFDKEKPTIRRSAKSFHSCQWAAAAACALPRCLITFNKAANLRHRRHANCGVFFGVNRGKQVLKHAKTMMTICVYMSRKRYLVHDASDGVFLPHSPVP